MSIDWEFQSECCHIKRMTFYKCGTSIGVVKWAYMDKGDFIGLATRCNAIQIQAGLMGWWFKLQHTGRTEPVPCHHQVKKLKSALGRKHWWWNQ